MLWIILTWVYLVISVAVFFILGAYNLMFCYGSWSFTKLVLMSFGFPLLPVIFLFNYIRSGI
jgi:hypothetical protein